MSDFSRPLKFAQEATGEDVAALESRLASQEVVVSIDPTLGPHGVLAARALISTLARLPGTIALDAAGLDHPTIKDLSAASEDVHGKTLRLDEMSSHAIHVHVGSQAAGPTIRIVPEGFGAHVTSDPETTLSPTRAPTVLGAIFAAALGATEIFKLAADIPISRARLHRSLSFCPVTLSNDLHAAPELPARVELDLALIGLGAVGSAAAMILSELDATGNILLVDRERFASENVATYSLGGDEDVIENRWKVDLAARSLHRRFRITTRTEPVETLPSKIDEGELHWPSIVISGLDSIEARHATQRIWPNLLIDAATGDTMIGIHTYQPDHACMICHLPPRTGGPSGLERLAAATGLPITLLARGDNELAEIDLTNLTDQQRSLLQPHIGKPICGLADAMGLTGLDSEGYQPAIPFAAQQAAVLAIGRLIAHIVNFPRSDNLVQYDAFRGPAQATIETRKRLTGCYCQERAATISRVRAMRSGL